MQKKLWLAPLVALVLVACDDDNNSQLDGAGGAAEASVPVSLDVTRALPKGDDSCAGGGSVLESGLDSNGNGTLDTAEITGTQYLQCLTAPRLRALHASPDAPRVNVLVNGAAALSNIDYTDGSGFLPVEESTRVQVEAIIPGGNAVVIDSTLTLEFSRDYTVIAAGAVAAPVGPLVFSNPTGAPIAPGSLRAQVVHAAPAAPAVDVYVTDPAASLASSTPINAAPLAYREATQQVEVPAGDYRLRVTAAGDPAAVVFDSGTVSLAAGADLMAVAVENTGPGATPIQLVVLDGNGASDLRDAATPATAVAVHASPDAPAVDLLADLTSTPVDEGLGLARNLAFPAACRIPTVPAPANYRLSVTPAGNPQVVALGFDVAATPAAEVTAVVTGYLASTPAIRALALPLDSRSVVTESKVRITHASPGTGAVDIYLMPDGTDLLAATTTPAFAAVPFGADTGLLSIAPSTYDVYVTPAGNKGVVAIEVHDLALGGGEVLDIIARDAASDGSEGPLPQLIVVDHASVGACAT